MRPLYPTTAKLLFRTTEAERAHHFAIRAFASGLVLPPRRPVSDPRLATEAFGVKFPNLLGLAAGFDKDGRVPDALLRVGFGFVEVGTLTPKAQPGNAQPRMFRLPADQALVNRLGFNNGGHEAALRRLGSRATKPGVVGVNVGANKDATDRVADYVAGIRAFAALAGYFTINVSSPNTPGLRDLQAKSALDELLAAVLESRDAAAAAHGRRVPVLLKVAPDLTDDGLADAVEVALQRKIDGLIVSNTTIARPSTLRDPQAVESGGLSGAPLLRPSTIVLARAYQLTEGALPLVGVGGVQTGSDLYEKVRAGASLVQLYSSMVYRGPWVASHVLREFVERLDREGVTDLGELRGSGAPSWAGRDLG